MEIQLSDISKREGGEMWIAPTSLRFQAGVFNILLGKTLAGKTTLLRLLAGLEKPTTGAIYFDGVDVTAKSVRQRDIAMVYQQFINYPNWRVYDNIASPLKVAGHSKARIERRVREVCELLQLTPLLKRYPHELSGGQQQRLALARALVKRAKLILLDEPLANLDYKLREELREELPALLADSGATVVYATTEPGEALLLGGYTAALHEGRVCQYGATHAVFKNPANLVSALTFSDPPLNCAEVEKRDGKLWLDAAVNWPIDARLNHLADGVYQLGLRPHQLLLRRAAADCVELTGRVDISEINGSESLLHVSVFGRAWVSQLHGVHKLELGGETPLYLDPRRCFLFDADGNRVGDDGIDGAE